MPCSLLYSLRVWGWELFLERERGKGCSAQSARMSNAVMFSVSFIYTVQCLFLCLTHPPNRCGCFLCCLFDQIKGVGRRGAAAEVLQNLRGGVCMRALVSRRCSRFALCVCLLKASCGEIQQDTNRSAGTQQDTQPGTSTAFLHI